MLKDITLGQYFPGDTPIHRLDPRTKLLLTVLYIACLFTAATPGGYVAAFAALALEMLLSRIGPRAVLRGLKPLVFIIIFTAVLNLFFSDGEHVLFARGRLCVTLEGLRNAVFMVLRVMFLVASTFLLTYTTSPLAITDGLERLFSPLKRLRVPVYELSLMMSIALRFIPTLIEDTDRILSAQKARGANFETGRLTERARALLPVLIPLFVSSFRRSEELADAMECRCYNGGEGRTRMKQLRFSPADFAALGGGALLLAVTILLRRIGL